ncbi:MAG: endonuclease domain-containing protein [Chloroflexi bacterium]|nr:endonuclease domain-containing protein [Chloroflexota bacterium]
MKDFRYRSNLKPTGRRLRSEMTKCERMLWSRLRRKQLHGVQFYRQKPIGSYIVDFYAPAARLVVEVDGPQHQDQINAQNDAHRDESLKSQGLRMLRFTNLQVVDDLDAVVWFVAEALKSPLPPFTKGG